MIIATLESVMILDEAEQLARMIVQSELGEHYRQCYYTLKQDHVAQELIRQFTAIKERYEEVQRFGKYHPDFSSVTKQMRELKRQVDLHETIASFKKAENDMQKLLDEVSVLIGQEVSPAIKVPTGNPFLMLAAAAEAAVLGEAAVVKRDEFPFFSLWTKADTERHMLVLLYALFRSCAVFTYAAWNVSIPNETN